MSDYSEHLISMAGGDGELADLRALVRAQQARLAVVAELANWSAKHGWKLDAAAIRAALRGES